MENQHNCYGTGAQRAGPATMRRGQLSAPLHPGSATTSSHQFSRREERAHVRLLVKYAEEEQAKIVREHDEGAKDQENKCLLPTSSHGNKLLQSGAPEPPIDNGMYFK